jgi:hypothetical protein
LQAIRAWTKGNHLLIHNLAAERLSVKVADRFWNEHNFVFRRSDGLFYHGKGATPAFDGWADDATDLTLIPLNMAEPVLIVRGKDAPHGLGFSPHGAGRNFSRTQHRRMQAGRSDADIFAEETKGIDARFFSAQRLQERAGGAPPDRALRPCRSGRRGAALRLHHGWRLGSQRAVAQEEAKPGVVLGKRRAQR